MVPGWGGTVDVRQGTRDSGDKVKEGQMTSGTGARRVALQD